MKQRCTYDNNREVCLEWPTVVFQWAFSNLLVGSRGLHPL